MKIQIEIPDKIFDLAVDAIACGEDGYDDKVKETLETLRDDTLDADLEEFDSLYPIAVTVTMLALVQRIQRDKQEE